MADMDDFEKMSRWRRRLIYFGLFVFAWFVYGAYRGLDAKIGGALDDQEKPVDRRPGH